MPEEMYFNSWSNKYFAEIYGVSIVEDLSQANYAITTMGQEIGKGSWEIIKKYKLPSGVELLLLKKFGD